MLVGRLIDVVVLRLLVGIWMLIGVHFFRDTIDRTTEPDSGALWQILGRFFSGQGSQLFNC